MTDQLKRITRKVCEEISIEHGLKHPDAVMVNPKLRRLAHEMIELALKEENEPKMPKEKVLEITPEGKVIDVPEIKKEWEKAHTGPEPEGPRDGCNGPHEDLGNGGETIIEMELEPEEERLKEPRYPGEGEEKTLGS
jgi:hypothetical protein